MTQKIFSLFLVLQYVHFNSSEVQRCVLPKKSFDSINCIFPCRNIRETGNELKGPSQADDVTWRQLICLPFADAFDLSHFFGFSWFVLWPKTVHWLRIKWLKTLFLITDSKECTNKGQDSEDDWGFVVTEFLHYQDEPASGWSKHAKDDCYSEEKRRHKRSVDSLHRQL